MCLRFAVDRPGDVLARGEHAGHEFNVVHNGNGYRCGYVKVGPGHPWFGKDDSEDFGAEVHGGITFGEADIGCGKGGPDDGWWVGFDCAHSGDAPDPELPRRSADVGTLAMTGFYKTLGMIGTRGTIRDQAYVEAECRSLCEQAAAASSG
jgi:hypothetical protein